MLKNLIPTSSAVLISCAGAASAQQTDWDFSASIYLFGAGTTTSIDSPAGSVETELSFGDALENLDFAFMGAFEAHNGRWGAFVDFMYYDLAFDADISGPNFARSETSLEMTAVTAAGLYRAYEGAVVTLDLVAGFRWFDIDSAVELTPAGGAAVPVSFGAGSDWIDPIIGARARFAFDRNWSATVYADYGGFSGDSETWQVLVTADYTINERWTLRGGYRHISFDHDIGDSNLHIEQSGPVLGVTFQF
ncbi:porin family protein [Pseudoruegeria sp. HB172150]|uniref:porin family protein n=1 Tax=Pseudoruegeria sp. HB172150 TaxID=2721164 RepID=UPI00155824AB|nr:porin family protein [Pseudoruegeria sp. HB172150]